MENAVGPISRIDGGAYVRVQATEEIAWMLTGRAAAEEKTT
ncbi:MAG TPA: hypothetical protein VHO06_24350 [Polyangia bacterium]|nr:hypothetical protein [Polyangia bacterium]